MWIFAYHWVVYFEFQTKFIGQFCDIFLWIKPHQKKHPAPVEVGSLSHYQQGNLHPRWLAGFLPSTVYVKHVDTFCCFGLFISKDFIFCDFFTLTTHLMPWVFCVQAINIVDDEG